MEKFYAEDASEERVQEDKVVAGARSRELLLRFSPITTQLPEDNNSRGKLPMPRVTSPSNRRIELTAFFSPPLPPPPPFPRVGRFRKRQEKKRGTASRCASINFVVQCRT